MRSQPDFGTIGVCHGFGAVGVRGNGFRRRTSSHPQVLTVGKERWYGIAAVGGPFGEPNAPAASDPRSRNTSLHASINKQISTKGFSNSPSSQLNRFFFAGGPQHMKDHRRCTYLEKACELTI